MDGASVLRASTWSLVQTNWAGPDPPANSERPARPCDELERSFYKQHRAIEPHLSTAEPELVLRLDIDHEPVIAEPQPEVVERIVLEVQGRVCDLPVDVIKICRKNLRARKFAGNPARSERHVVLSS